MDRVRLEAAMGEARPAAWSSRAEQDPARIEAMFDAIAARYDRLNRVLSAGLDRRWRRRAVEALHLAGGETVLDVCTGTADLAIASASAMPGRIRVIGVDFAAGMLRLGRRKLAARRLSAVTLIRGDAMRLPIGDETVDDVTIAFGIRNVQHPATACRELRRVLRPGGRVAILEFGIPRVPVLGRLYLWYFRRALPWIGRIVSRHASAYAYLPQSVGRFPPPTVFAATLEDAGFVGVRTVPLTLGVVYLYVARRADGQRGGIIS
jgi:demethylmenaquinone methyltransferase / 2-methoxy-6-polyprenyl-1,4-benzoquinol methylase